MDLRTVRPDSKGRVTLGNLAAGISSFKAYKDREGRIVLEPQIEVPAVEAWLWQNRTAMESVQRGLKEAGEGKRVNLGSFAQHAQEG